MADTIVTNTPGPSDSGAAGWIVALIVLVAVVVGGVYMYRNGFFDRAATTDTTNINVVVPNPTAPAPVPSADSAPVTP